MQQPSFDTSEPPSSSSDTLPSRSAVQGSGDSQLAASLGVSVAAQREIWTALQANAQAAAEAPECLEAQSDLSSSNLQLSSTDESQPMPAVPAAASSAPAAARLDDTTQTDSSPEAQPLPAAMTASASSPQAATPIPDSAPALPETGTQLGESHLHQLPHATPTSALVIRLPTTSKPAVAAGLSKEQEAQLCSSAAHAKSGQAEGSSATPGRLAPQSRAVAQGRAAPQGKAGVQSKTSSHNTLWHQGRPPAAPPMFLSPTQSSRALPT